MAMLQNDMLMNVLAKHVARTMHNGCIVALAGSF
jgi:hypothetical protein